MIVSLAFKTSWMLANYYQMHTERIKAARAYLSLASEPGPTIYSWCYAQQLGDQAFQIDIL